jgi:hypothetical protein
VPALAHANSETQAGCPNTHTWCCDAATSSSSVSCRSWPRGRMGGVTKLALWPGCSAGALPSASSSCCRLLLCSCVTAAAAAAAGGAAEGDAGPGGAGDALPAGEAWLLPAAAALAALVTGGPALPCSVTNTGACVPALACLPVTTVTSYERRSAVASVLLACSSRSVWPPGCAASSQQSAAKNHVRPAATSVTTTCGTQGIKEGMVKRTGGREASITTAMLTHTHTHAPWSGARPGACPCRRARCATC